MWHPIPGTVLTALILVLTGYAVGSTASSAPPSMPANVSAVALNTQINLSWLALTDNLGVTGTYLVSMYQLKPQPVAGLPVALLHSHHWEWYLGGSTLSDAPIFLPSWDFMCPQLCLPHEKA
jgi:hypothetical protein